MGGRTSVVEKDAGPIDHTRGGTHSSHHSEDELTVKSVIGFGNVNEDMCPSSAVGNKDVRKEGREVDIVTYLAGREVGRLFRANCTSHGVAKTGRKDFGKDAVEGGEKGDGAVSNRDSAIRLIRLEERSDSAEIERRGGAASGADGSVKTSKKRRPCAVANAPQRVRKFVGARGGASRATGEGKLDFMGGNGCRTSSKGEMGGDGEHAARDNVSMQSSKDKILGSEI